MKKKLVVVAVLAMIFVMNISNVKAVNSSNVGTFIKENITVDVRSEHFTYKGISFTRKADEKGYGRINFDKITNTSDTLMHVSISIGLFNKDKINIGTINYCASKDLDSDYSGKTLKKGESTPFYVTISPKRHLTEDYKVEDIAYIAVINDNKFCKVGGADTYAGLTLEDINENKTADQVVQLTWSDIFGNVKLTSALGIIILVAIVIIILYILLGSMLNALNKRMYSKSTAMGWIPIANNYLAVKLSFGPTVAKMYMVLYIISLFIGIFFQPILYLVSIVGYASYIIVLIKLITKNYNLFYMEGNIKTNDDLINNFNINNKTDNDSNVSPVNTNTNTNSTSSLIETLMDMQNNPSANNQTSNYSPFKEAINNNTEEKQSSGEYFNFGNHNNNDNNNSNDNNNNNNNNSNGGSSLSDFFK